MSWGCHKNEEKMHLSEKSVCNYNEIKIIVSVIIMMMLMMMEENDGIRN